MRIALTGSSGIVGGFVLAAARTAGHHVTCLTRERGYRLGDAPDLSGQDALIHCAFAHVPGCYRGGEGDAPRDFIDANLHGSIRLFEAAESAGVPRIAFLSSRAVHDGHPPGTVLEDDLPPWPTTLYGHVKAEAENHLARMRARGTRAVALRSTGVYGPGRAHKWRALFARYLTGGQVSARVSTEVHGRDLAAAILLLLSVPDPPRTVNVSDLVLDRHDLLGLVQDLTGSQARLPPRADATGLRLPRCLALSNLGWQPGGTALLRATLPRLLDQADIL
ncbi:NAD-dependent epimerase/dehydratase family protein [Paracoccus salsus]|uniref:NAD-dependent epimerase/dehydratase family protein n=1 Tax=Paracoccus salsus TaxID=2911061 RepID=UPI001F16ADCD|nr:NAD(P)-dependent oxidoreductase [Paracoccus salsus]MCF3972804.1 NAD(P)-dependent oxidoreductase [Paracoccus salsus]